MTAILRRSSFELALLVAVGGCQSNQRIVQRTELVVQVDSNLAVPGELDKVEVTVTANGKTQYLPCSLITDCKLPWDVGVVEATAGADSIEIVATGYLNGSAIVNETAVLSFVEGESMLLKLFLAAECRGDPCTDPDQTCTTGGVCRQKVRTPSELKPYAPAASGGSGGNFGSGGSGGNSDAGVPDVPGGHPDVADIGDVRERLPHFALDLAFEKNLLLRRALVAVHGKTPPGESTKRHEQQVQQQQITPQNATSCFRSGARRLGVIPLIAMRTAIVFFLGCAAPNCRLVTASSSFWLERSARKFTSCSIPQSELKFTATSP